jgi:hypothetical protein
MEEGSNGLGQFGATGRRSIYKNACATLSNTLLAWGRLDLQPFGEPASRFTSAIERSGIWKGR